MESLDKKIEALEVELQDLVVEYNKTVEKYQEKVKEYQADLDNIQKTTQEIALKVNRKEEALKTLLELKEEESAATPKSKKATK